MRVLKIIGAVVFLGLAIAVGVVATAVVAGVGILVFLVRRLLRRKIAAPQRPVMRRGDAAAGDAIDVVATDVSSERRQLP